MERDSPVSSPVKSCTSSPLQSIASSPPQSPVTSPVHSVTSSPFQAAYSPALREFPPSPFVDFSSPTLLSPSDHHDNKRRKLDDQVSNSTIHNQRAGQHCRDLFNEGTEDEIDNIDSHDSVNRQADDERRSELDEQESIDNVNCNITETVDSSETTQHLHEEYNNDQEEVPTQDNNDETESSSEEDCDSSKSSSEGSSDSSEEEAESHSSSSESDDDESVMSEREESSNSEDDSAELLSPKVYENCDLSVDEGVLTLMNLFTKHKMSKTQMGGVLDAVLKFIPKSSNLPKTQYSLLNYVHKLSPISEVKVHFYCSKCLFYLGLVEMNCCHLCSGQPHKFYQIPLGDQVRNFFENHGLADVIDKYSEKRNIADFGGGFSDMLDGSEFNRARVNGPYNLTFMGHTDGISISDSSDASLWPLEWVAAELPPHLRFKYIFISGIWVDNCKPYMNTLMAPFVEELQQLRQHGVKWVDPKTKEAHVTFITVPSFCVDSTVRAQLQNILLHGGRHCCHICEQKMKKLPPQPVLPGKKKKARRRVYTFAEHEATLRTSDRMEAQGKKTRRRLTKYGGKLNPEIGVKGPSVISGIPGCDRSTAVFPEYMHLLLCVVKQFFSLWFVISGRWSLQEHRDEINKFLLSIRVPDFITRIPRSTEKFTKWKANELRSFVLFYSVIILSKCMTQEYFQHWLLFVNAIYLLLQEHVSQNDVAKANILLRMFCRDFANLYSPAHYTYYMHNLLHLAVTVERHGPLHCNAGF